MTDCLFPIPFSGIEYIVPFKDLRQLFDFLDADVHQHHVAIDWTPAGPRLWGSSALPECADKWFRDGMNNA